jgi:hypothetical protein
VSSAYGADRPGDDCRENECLRCFAQHDVLAFSL